MKAKMTIDAADRVAKVDERIYGSLLNSSAGRSMTGFISRAKKQLTPTVCART